MVKRKTPAADPQQLLSALSRRLAGCLGEDFYGQEENVSYLMELVSRTVEKGESNSLLVLGPRGVGKTALVSHVMRKAAAIPSWRDNAVRVELSGLIQTDDKLALRDITKQLKLENVVGDRVFGSFAEHLSFLLASLKTGDSTASKPIVFILDHFECFCSHKNQTLLYNLFDVAQSKAVPITVIGVSSEIDVTELLEKRVKSRFSHRHLYIWPVSKLEEYLDIVSWMLRLTGDQFVSWNENIQKLIESKGFKKLMEQKVFAVDKSLRHLKQVLHGAVVRMVQTGDTLLQLNHLDTGVDLGGNLETNSMIDLIRDLSVTEICILIAIKHLEDIYDGEPFNFEMMYHEFVKFKRRKFSTLPDDRSVLSKCWENLLELELVSAKGGGGRGGVQEQYSLHVSQVPASSLKQALEKYPNCPTEVIQWFSSSHHTASH